VIGADNWINRDLDSCESRLECRTSGATVGATGAISELEEPSTNPPIPVKRAREIEEIRAINKVFIEVPLFYLIY